MNLSDEVHNLSPFFSFKHSLTLDFVLYPEIPSVFTTEINLSYIPFSNTEPMLLTQKQFSHQFGQHVLWDTAKPTYRCYLPASETLANTKGL